MRAPRASLTAANDKSDESGMSDDDTDHPLIPMEVLHTSDERATEWCWAIAERPCRPLCTGATIAALCVSRTMTMQITPQNREDDIRLAGKAGRNA